MTLPIQLISLTNLGILQFQGAAVTRFLQGQVTCDVEKLNENEILLGAHCNVKGRVLFNFRLFYYQDHLCLCLPRALLEDARIILQTYAKFSKVTIQDQSDALMVYGVIGDAMLPNEVCWKKISGSTARYLGIAPVAEQVYIREQYTDYHVDENVWRHAEIQAGIVTIMPQTSGLFTPHALNYPALGAVSFNKGCYTGQEIVARMEYLGKLKEQLYRLNFISRLKPSLADSLQDEAGKEAGKIADYCENDEKNAWTLLAPLAVGAISKPLYCHQQLVQMA